MLNCERFTFADPSPPSPNKRSDRELPFLSIVSLIIMLYCSKTSSSSRTLSMQQFYTKLIEASRRAVTKSAPQGIRHQFLRDPWIHFCNGYFEIYLFFNSRNNVFLIFGELLLTLRLLMSYIYIHIYIYIYIYI